MGLSHYHKKRNFSKTPEPEGKIAHKQSQVFIIQKHAASHLHYDFRIELDGVLKSWAVPKGPSLDPKVKRLAVHVDDHPLEYASFEGIIPKGQYGGGTVMLWDQGTWEPLDNNPSEAYKKGHLRFELHAKKLQGRWDLVRLKDENNWFLIKYQDKYARSQDEYDITELDKSVVSQNSLNEITKHYKQIWQDHGVQKLKLKKPRIILPKGLKESGFPDFIPPQLATLADKPPTGKQWIHEIKFDGYRLLAFKNGSNLVLKSRNNRDWTKDLHSIVDAILQLPFKQLVLDGEISVLDEEGRSNFQLLQNALKNKEHQQIVYFLFDLLYFEGYDLRSLGLIQRKSILKKIISNKLPVLQYSDHISEGKELYAHACKHGLEGIIAKQKDGAYLSKRNKEWLKIKCIKRQEFVIGAYTTPKGTRAHFGSLLLGVYTQKGELRFVGHVGTGFDKNLLDDIYQRLQKNKSKTNPFNTKPQSATEIHWVTPKLVCEVEFTEWTKDNHLRHPSFKGLRFDKKASDVIHESKIIEENFVITNPDKVLYPEDNITKQDLLSYYETVSDLILPYLALRPLTLVRCPSNYEDSFYQRHFNKKTATALHPIKDKQEKEPYIYLDDKKGLFGLVQMDVLEIHPWGSVNKHLDKPDVLVIDLDPGPEVPWSRVVAAAREVRDYLSQYQLISFVKSTGGKGLHVVVPILPEYDWDEVKEFAHVFVQCLEKLKPKEYVTTMAKAKRVGKIYIDYLRNQKGATAIAPYSTRARLHAPIATPLFWDELSNKQEDNTYTLKTILKRLSHLKEDPWKEFWTIKQSLRLEEL